MEHSKTRISGGRGMIHLLIHPEVGCCSTRSAAMLPVLTDSRRQWKEIIMNNRHQSEPVSPPKRRGRGCLVWLGGILAVFLGLMLFGALYESVAEAADVRA